MKILIAGAGRGGLSLAVRLQANGNEVTLIERDPIVATRASEEYGVVALVGEATDARILRQADLEHADSVLAMLSRDADNLTVAMLARSLGARRVMVRMRDPEFRAVYEAAGVEQILSETEILVGALATAVEFESVRQSMTLSEGEAIAIEMVVPDQAWVVGRTVSEIAGVDSFPPTCVLAGMTLDGAVKAPRGASILDAGARILVVSSRRDLPATVRFFLRRDP